MQALAPLPKPRPRDKAASYRSIRGNGGGMDGMGSFLMRLSTPDYESGPS
jgi:hypothetical protein